MSTSAVDIDDDDDAKIVERRQVNPQTMGRYFSETYPSNSLWDMLSGGDSKTATTVARHREFAFTFVDEATKEEHMRRHVSFDDREAFARYIKEQKPYRIDVGGAYFVAPVLAKLYENDPIEGASISSEVGHKELTFDVDVDAYDKPPGRTCCSGRDWCRSCWPILGMGCVAMDVALRNLGAHRVKWFFSGGRGIHCWVLDEKFATPDAAMRSAFVSFVAPSRLDAESYVSGLEESRDPGRLEIVRLFVGDRASRDNPYCSCRKDERFSDGDRRNDAAKTCLLHAGSSDRGFFFGWYATRHPAVAVRTILEVFDRKKKRNQKNQSLNKDKKSTRSECDAAERRMRDALPDVEVVASALDAARKGCPKGAVDVCIESVFLGWDEATPEFESAKRVFRLLEDLSIRASAHVSEEWAIGDGGRHDEIGEMLCEAAFECLAPRVDLPVAVQTNHLLKAPMSVHPLTGRLAVCLCKSELLSFLPTDAPRVRQNLDGATTNCIFECGGDSNSLDAEMRRFANGV